MKIRIRAAKKNADATLRARIWIAAAALVLATGVMSSRLPSLRAALHVPATPLDLTSARCARFWNFLMQIRDAVPSGASYTIRALDPDDEMYLFMFSLGILYRQKSLPSSYFGVPTPSFGERARFVVVYGAALPGSDCRRVVRRVGDGFVCERPAGG